MPPTTRTRNPLGPLANGRNHAVTAALATWLGGNLSGILGDEVATMAATAAVLGAVGFLGATWRNFNENLGESLPARLGKRLAAWIG